MGLILILAFAAILFLGVWAIAKAKHKILRILGALFCSLTIGLAAAIIWGLRGMPDAWSGGNQNSPLTAFALAAGSSLLVLVAIALRRNKEPNK
jgi:ABC-type sulfate transport system permease component